MTGATLLLWAIWGAAAVAALSLFVVTRRRRAHADPAQHRPGPWRAHRAPALLVAVATVAVLAPSIVSDLNLGGLTARASTQFPPTLPTVCSLVAALLLLTGAAIVACWAIGDPARGRKRCRGCWYDMSGATTMVCPECGRKGEGETAFQRTRRPRRLLVLAAVAVLLAGPTWLMPSFRDGTWPERVPTLALILVLPHLPDGTPLLPELERRLNPYSRAIFPIEFLPEPEPMLLEVMPRWQRRLLARQCIRAIAAPTHPGRTGVAIDALMQLGGDAESALPLLVRMIGDPAEYDSRCWPRDTFSNLGSLTGLLAERLAEGLSGADTRTREHLFKILGEIGQGSTTPVDCPAALLDYARTETSPHLRQQAMFTVGSFTLSDGVSDLAGALTRDEDEHVRGWAVLVLGTWERSSDRSIRARVDALGDSSPVVRAAGARMVGLHGPHTPESVTELLIACRDAGAAIALSNLGRSTCPDDIKFDALTTALADPASLEPALFAVSAMRESARPLLPRLRELESDAEPLDNAEMLNHIRRVIALVEGTEPPAGSE